MTHSTGSLHSESPSETGQAPESRFVGINGLKLHYFEWPGNGRPLLFVHGSNHCAGIWSPLAENLSDTFHVYALDLRGHGQSEKPETGYAWTNLRDDIVELLRQLDLHDVLFVSHSRGGGATLLACAQAAERVRGAVMYEPNISAAMALANPDGRHGPATDRLQERAQRRYAVFPSRQAFYDRYRNRDAFKNWREDFFVAYMDHGTRTLENGEVELQCSPFTEAQLMEEMPKTEAWVGLKDVSVPTLVCHGDGRGPVAGAGVGEAAGDPSYGFRKILPSAKIVYMPGCSHNGYQEKPELFEQHIRDFERTLR